MVPDDSLPAEQETWEQFSRICRHAIFTHSANHQALLRDLIQRLYAGSEDFAAKVLASELFRRDTSIAKVEGRAVRSKLDAYYDSDGRSDPIIIRIPSRTFKPQIVQRIKPLSGESIGAAMFAQTGVFYPTSDGLEMVKKHLNDALVADPNHPCLLALKALCNISAIYLGQDPVAAFESVEYLLHDVESKKFNSPEASFANAALLVSKYRWHEADLKFHECFNSLAPLDTPYFASPLYVHFMAAQLRFDEGLRLINRGAWRKNAEGAPEFVHSSALLHIMAGNLDEAERQINVAYSGPRSYPEEYLAPVSSLLHAAKGDFATALTEIHRVHEKPIQTVLGTAAPGLVALLTGLNGDVALASEMYSEFKAQRQLGLDIGFYAPPIRIPAFNLVLAAIGVNLLDDAVAWLEIAIKEREPLAAWSHVLPVLQPLHKLVPFRSLVISKMKLKFAG